MSPTAPTYQAGPSSAPRGMPGAEGSAVSPDGEARGAPSARVPPGVYARVPTARSTQHEGGGGELGGGGDQHVHGEGRPPGAHPAGQGRPPPGDPRAPARAARD